MASLENKVLSSLHKNQSLTILYKGSEYDSVQLKLFNLFFKEFGKIGIVEIDSDFEKVTSFFKENKISNSDYFLINLSTDKMVKSSNKFKTVLLDGSVDKMSKNLENIAGKSKIAIVVFNDISNIFRMKKEVLLLKLINDFSKRLRDKDIKVVYILSGDNVMGVLNEVLLFVDDVIVT